MASKFKKGDEVSYTGKKSGTVFHFIVDGIATNGDVWVVEKDNPQKEAQFKPYQLTLVKSAPQAVAPVSGPQTFRWVCLECDKKHNARICPQCGSDEHIHNTDADTDPSVLLGGTPAEPYRPRDDA